MLRRLALTSLTGLVVGIAALGLGGRIAMRILAVAAHRPTHFGLGASLGILLIGGILGILASTPVAAVSRWRTRRPVTVGVLYGTGLFLILIPMQPQAIRAEIVAFEDHLWLASTLFWTVCVVYAVILVARILAQARQQVSAAPRAA
jgi:hypothetical protein